MSIRLRIAETRRIATEERVAAPLLDDGLPRHESGLDSPGFAILAARLDDDLDIDPLTLSMDAPFPLAAGAFVKADENVAA